MADSDAYCASLLSRAAASHARVLSGEAAEQAIDDVAQFICTAAGWPALRDGQREAIRAVTLQEQHRFLMWAPGQGKSVLLYAAVLALGGVWTMVVPMNVIGTTHADELQKLGVAVINTTGDSACEADAITAVRAARLGGAPLVVIARPEFVTSVAYRAVWHAALTLGSAIGVCVDEAGLVTAWGYSFRPEFRELHNLGTPTGGRWIVLDGSSTAEDVERTRRALHIPDCPADFTPAGRANTTLRFVHLNSDRFDPRAELLRGILEERGIHSKGIIFCRTIDRVKKLLSRILVLCEDPDFPLAKEEIEVYFRTEGQDDLLLSQRLERFNNDEGGRHDGNLRIFISTIALSRGINMVNVDWVFQADAPPDMPEWLQKAGRARRENVTKEGLCVTVWSFRDRCLHRRLVLEQMPAACDEDVSDAERVLHREREQDCEAQLHAIDAFTMMACRWLCRHRALRLAFAAPAATTATTASDAPRSSGRQAAAAEATAATTRLEAEREAERAHAESTATCGHCDVCNDSVPTPVSHRCDHTRQGPCIETGSGSTTLGAAKSAEHCWGEITHEGRRFIRMCSGRPRTVLELKTFLVEHTGLHSDCVKKCLHVIFTAGILHDILPYQLRGGEAATSASPPHKAWCVQLTDRARVASWEPIGIKGVVTFW